MTSRRRLPPPGALRLSGLLAAILLSSCAASTLTQTYRDPSFRASPVKHVLVLGVAVRDESLQRSFEEAFARTLRAHGYEVSTGSSFLKPWELDEGTIVRYVKEHHVDLVTEFDLVSTTQSTMTPATSSLSTAPGPVGTPFSPDPVTGGGGQPWGFTVLRQPGKVTEDTDVMAEIKVYSVRAERLVWSGVSRTFHARGDADVGDSLSLALLKDLSKAKVLPD